MSERVPLVVFRAIAVLWLAAMLGAAIWGWPVSWRFETNDDYWMLQIASGRYTGSPSEFLLYIHVALGLLLKTLFLHWPHFNSYAFVLLIMHMAFACSVMCCLRHTAKSGFTAVYLMATAALFHGFVFFRLQFTTSAFVGAAAAFMVLLAGVIHPADNPRARISTSVWATLLWAVAWMIRKEAALLAALLAAPMLLYAVMKHRRGPAVALMVAQVLVLCGGLTLFERWYMTRHPEWERFQRFNRARGRIHVAPGYGFDSQSRSVYAGVGWSENDVSVFQQWFFPDANVHSPEKIEHVARSLRRPMPVRSAVATWLGTLREQRFFVVAMLVLAAGLLMAQKKWTSPFLIALVLSGVLQIYLQGTARLPPRVFLPLLFGPTLFLLPSAGLPSQPVSRIAGRIWVVVLLLAMLWAGKRYVILRRTHDEMSAAWKIAEVQEQLAGARALVLWADDWPVEWAPVRLKWSEAGKSCRYVSLSSLTQSPHHWTLLKQLQVGDLVEALLTREDVLLACRANRLPNLERYVAEHYGTFARVEDRGGLFNRRIYKLTPDEQTDTRSVHE